jgi:hypothetical protein
VDVEPGRKQSSDRRIEGVEPAGIGAEGRQDQPFAVTDKAAADDRAAARAIPGFRMVVAADLATLGAALTVRGRGLRRRCFLTDGRRVILPAFGAYAGGLNALHPAIAQLFPDDYDALIVGRDAVRRLSWRQLRPDATLC